MSGKRDRKNRGRKRKRSKLRHVSPGQLLDQARESLAQGDGRKALDLLRQAQHADERLEGLPLLSFCACMQRARQLAAKDMAREAAAMRSRAAQHRAIFSLRALAEDDLVLYLRHLDLADALEAYGDYLSTGPPVLRAERMLADRLVVHGGKERLQALGALDPDHPLRRDAGTVAGSLDAMDAGDWARAARLLQGVSRRSPFAPWRLFCKAMVCFGAGDDEGLRRIVGLLPGDFILSRTVAEWKRLCNGEDDGGAPEVQRALGLEHREVAALAGEFRQALQRGQTRAAGRSLDALAVALYPGDPLQARIDLLGVVGLSVLRDKLPATAILELSRRLLPADRVAGVSSRIGLMVQQVSPDLWDPTPAGIFLSRLPVEFPRAPERALARGRVFEALARAGHKAVSPELLPPRKLKEIAALLGEGVEDPAMIFVQLMMASLAADPGNRDGYFFLLDLLRGRTADKPRLREILHEMAARFPDDPAPWLELATLHYSRNAYRRAEDALAEARERAPHDERILDLQAVGFLKSADQSRKNGRLPRAARDLERAEAMGRSLLGLVLPVKRLMLEVVSGSGNTAAAVASGLERLSAGEQLRALALLIRDLDDNAHVRNVKPEMGDALRGLLAGKAALAGTLGPDEVVALLVPLPSELRILYDRLQVAPVLEALWPGLMERVEGDRLITVFYVLMDCGGHAPVRAEIDRRLRGVAKARRDPLLLFYLAVIRHLEGQDHDSRRFADILKRADAPARERLRAAAARLAHHADGLLRQALQEFDFKLLDLPPLPFGLGGPPSLDELLSPIGGDEPSLGDVLDELDRLARRGGRGGKPPLEWLLDAIEGDGADTPPDGPSQGSLFGDEAILVELGELDNLIDESGLRGAPSHMLKEFVGDMRSDPGARQALERIARECEAADLRDTLSREVHALLFPRKGSRSRKRRR